MKIFIIFIIFFPALTFALEITSDTLEYFEKDKRYEAIGNVHIKDETFIFRADKVVYYEQTKDIEGYENFYYEDEEIIVWAKEGKMNLEKKTAVLKNAILHIKKRDFWITAEEIERLSEIKYRAKKATFSTCEIQKEKSQPWCFSAEAVDLVLDEIFISKMTTFKVKDIPLVFTPVFWGPGGTNRKSGFLPFRVGNSNTRGVQLSAAYYLVIDSSKDLTAYIDYLSKTGIGKGIEYRYIDFNTKGMWYAYQIDDRQLDRSYLELRAVHLQKTKGLDIILDINYVNKNDFYKEYGDTRSISNTYLFRQYGKDLQGRYSSFLQSSAEVSLSLVGSRFYLLTQSWKDLRYDGVSPPGKIELGYVVYPYKFGLLNINFNTNLAEYYKEDGLKGLRFELSPELTYSFGDIIKISQSLSLKGILYNLKETSPYENISHREMILYNAKVFSRLYKNTESIFHLLEPFFEGLWIGVSGKPPVLSSIELVDSTALIRAGFYNKLKLKNIDIEGRVAQIYDFRAKGEWSRLYPLLIEGILTFWKIRVGFDTYQNISKGKIERFNSWISFTPDENTSIYLSQRYTTDNAISPSYIWSPTLRNQYSFKQERGIKTYSVTVVKNISQRWSLSTNINYNANGEGLRDSSFNVRYSEKCWATNVSVARRPILREGKETSEFSFTVLFELKGVGAIKLL
ncbi:MAG: LPS assembly protein LptD [Thermodesulfovibrionaceae bacterium]